MSKYPSDWLSKPLGKVYPKIVVGYVGNVNDHYCRAEEGVPFYRTLNIRDGYFRHSEHLYVTHEFNEKNKKSQITNNDILIARVGANLGMVCKANGISGLANMANAIIIKTNDVNSADADFYTSFLLSPMGKNQIYSGAAGGAQGVFNTKLTQEIIVPVPPLPEQRKIAQILSTWDRGIATTEKLIEASKQQKKALMQQLLTGKKRLVDPETGKAFEGEWEEIRFDHCCDIVEGQVDPKDEPYASMPHIGPGNMEKFTGVLREYKSAKEDGQTSGKYLFEKNHVLYGKINPHFAKVCFPKFTGVCSADTYPIKVKGGLTCPKFLMYSLLSNRFTSYAVSVSARTGMPKINRNDLSAFKFLVPSSNEQQKIASVLTAADKEIELLEAKLAHLKQEKKALMQQLLTGKRRVQVEAA